MYKNVLKLLKCMVNCKTKISKLKYMMDKKVQNRINSINKNRRHMVISHNDVILNI